RAGPSPCPSRALFRSSRGAAPARWRLVASGRAAPEELALAVLRPAAAERWRLAASGRAAPEELALAVLRPVAPEGLALAVSRLQIGKHTSELQSRENL